MKQEVTFTRIQTVTMVFDVPQPMTKEHAAAWAAFAFGGKPPLDDIVAGKVEAPHAKSETLWTPTAADPAFAPEPKKRRRGRSTYSGVGV